MSLLHPKPRKTALIVKLKFLKVFCGIPKHTFKNMPNTIKVMFRDKCAKPGCATPRQFYEVKLILRLRRIEATEGPTSHPRPLENEPSDRAPQF